MLTLALERYGGRRTVLIALHVTERLNALNSSLQKNAFCFLVDKDIGAIWPNSCAQSQMKLFAGKINPCPLPLFRPCICQVFVGVFWVYWSCLRHAAICVSVSETVTACAARQNTHGNKHTRKKHRSVNARCQVY